MRKFLKLITILSLLLASLLLLAACGGTEASDEAHEHTLIEVSAVPPTCTKEGVQAATVCAECGETVSGGELIPTISHLPKAIPASAATCDKDGYTAGEACEYCGKRLSGLVTIPAYGHTEVTLEAVEATCTTAGHTAGVVCSDCNATVVAPDIIPAAHKPEDVAEIPATCTTAGRTAGKVCSVCDEVLEGLLPIPGGHQSFDEAAIPPTCTAPGFTAGRKCSVCDTVLEGCQALPLVAHSFDIPTDGKAPTCTEYGYGKGHICSSCGRVDSDEIIPATGHTPTACSAVAPTCTASGFTAGERCSVCNEAVSGCEHVPAIGHTPGAVTEKLAPQIGVCGLGSSVCTVCSTPFEMELPMIPGKMWSYDGDGDLVSVVDGSGITTVKQETDGDRTYATVSYDNPQLKSGEPNVLLFPDERMNILDYDRYFVFETDMRFNNIDNIDSYNDNWFMYTCLTDSTSVSGDYNHVVVTWYFNSTEDGVTVRIGNKSGAVVPYQEWFRLRAVYRLNADDPMKCDIEYFLNGNSVYKATTSMKNGTSGVPADLQGKSKLNDPIVGFKLKFKSKANFDAISISLDNSYIVEYEIEEAEKAASVDDSAWTLN